MVLPYRLIIIGVGGCKQYNILYIVWVLGLYGEYKTFARRYQPSASPQADISGLRSYIRHIHLEPILYILHIYIYIYVTRKAKTSLMALAIFDRRSVFNSLLRGHL